jgi:hypothetical protein
MTDFSEQLHMDYPSKEDIDKLTDEQLVDIWVNSPVGYLRLSSGLAAYFVEQFDKRSLDTNKIHKQMTSTYMPKLKDFKDRNPERTGPISRMAVHFWEEENG